MFHFFMSESPTGGGLFTVRCLMVNDFFDGYGFGIVVMFAWSLMWMYRESGGNRLKGEIQRISSRFAKSELRLGADLLQ